MPDIPIDEGYGYTQCVAIDDSEGVSPWQNADTYALFATGAFLLSPLHYLTRLIVVACTRVGDADTWDWTTGRAVDD